MVSVGLQVNVPYMSSDNEQEYFSDGIFEEVPGIAILSLFHDQAGNPLSLVEMDGDTVKIP